MQYMKLAEDWRYFNTLLWGIPSVAIAIMAGIIVAAYQKDVTGWARIAALGLGSFLLFALMIESIKKRQHMDAISCLLKDLQGETGLKLDPAFTFRVGLSYDIEIYLKNKEVPHDKIFDLFKVFYAREVLTLVVFVSATVVAGLTDYEFVNFFNNFLINNKWPQIALIIPISIAIFVPLTILGIVVCHWRKNKRNIQNTLNILGGRGEEENGKRRGAPL